MALHLPIGSLKTRSVLEPVPRCESSTYQPISRSVSDDLVPVITFVLGNYFQVRDSPTRFLVESYGQLCLAVFSLSLPLVLWSTR